MALDAGSVKATLIAEVDDRGFVKFDSEMKKVSGRKATAELGAKVDERGFREASLKGDEFARKRYTATMNFDVDRNSLQQMIAGLDNVGRSASTAESSTGRFGSALSALPIVGITAGIVALSGGITALAAGALVAGTQGLAALGQSFAAVKLATDGVGAALTAYEAQQKAAGVTAQRAAGQQVSAAEQQASSANTLRTAQEGVANANRNVTVAQQALTLTQFAAQRQMEDLKRAAVDTANGVKDSMFAVDDAKKALEKAIADPTSTGLQIREARQAVIDAHAQHRDAAIGASRAQQDYNIAQREGINGMPQVVAAQRAVADSQRALSDATRQFAYDQRQANLHSKQTAQSMKTAATSANQFQQALADLTPAQRQFVRFLIPIREQFDKLRQTVAAGLFPGVEKGITAAMKNFGPFQKIMGETGKAIGHVANQFGHFLGSNFGRRLINVLGGTNVKLIHDFGNVLDNLAHAFGRIMLAAQPLVRWMGRMAVEVSKQFASWVKGAQQSGALAQFFASLKPVLTATGDLLLKLGEGIGKIGVAAMPAFTALAKALIPAVPPLTKIGEVMAKLLQILGPSLIQLVTTFVKAFADLSPALVPIAKGLADVIKGLNWLLHHVPGLNTPLGTMVGFFGTWALLKWGSIAEGLKNARQGLGDLAGRIKGFGTFVKNIPFYAQYGASVAGDWIKGFGGKIAGAARSVKALMGRIFGRIAKAIGLQMGETMAADTVGGEAAGGAAGGLIGKMRGLMGKLRGALGKMFRALGSFIGLQMAEKTVEATAAGDVAGAAGGGIVGGLRSRLGGPLRGMGSTLGGIFAAGFILTAGNQILSKLMDKLGLKGNPGANTDLLPGLHGQGITHTALGGQIHGASGPGATWIEYEQEHGAVAPPWMSRATFAYAQEHDSLTLQQLREYQNRHEGGRGGRGGHGKASQGSAVGAGPSTGSAPPVSTGSAVAGSTIVGGPDPGEARKAEQDNVKHAKKLHKDTTDQATATHDDVLKTQKQITEDVDKEQRNLEDKSAKNTKAIHDDAVSKQNDLHDSTNKSWVDLTKLTSGHQAAMLNSTQTNFGAMAKSANVQGGKLKAAITDSMDSAAQATFAGMKYVATATDKALKALGVKGITLTLAGPPGGGKGAQVKPGGGKGGGAAKGGRLRRYAGGLIPGYSMVDDQTIAVRGGERVLTPEVQFPIIDNIVRNSTGFGVDDVLRGTGGVGYRQGGHVPKGGKPGYAYPYPKQYSPDPYPRGGRIDEGTDPALPVGTPIGAIGDAKITSNINAFSNYPGEGVVYELANPVSGYAPSSPWVYIYESFRRSPASTGVGKHVSAGESLGQIANFESTGIEMGWAMSGQGPALAHNIYNEGDRTPQGLSFEKLLEDLHGGKSVQGGGPAGGGHPVPPIVRKVEQQIKKLAVMGPAGPLKDLAQAALDKAGTAADALLRKKTPQGTGTIPGGKLGVNIANLPPSLKPYNRTWPHAGGYDYAGWAALPKMPPDKIAELAEWVGLPGVTMQQITVGESGGGKPGSLELGAGSGPDPSRPRGVGLFAITPPYADGDKYPGGTLSGDYMNEMFNPVYNAIVAKQMAPNGPNSGIWHGSSAVKGWNLHYKGPMRRKGGIVRGFQDGGMVDSKHRHPWGGGFSNKTISYAQFRHYANIARRITGHKGDFSTDGLLRLAKQENGWGIGRLRVWPRPIHDRNSRAGNPSLGLMQLTWSNFQKYHHRGSGDPADPLASIAASIRYQKGVYGHQVTHSPYARGGRVPGFQDGGKTHFGPHPGHGPHRPHPIHGHTHPGHPHTPHRPGPHPPIHHHFIPDPDRGVLAGVDKFLIGPTLHADGDLLMEIIGAAPEEAPYVNAWNRLEVIASSIDLSEKNLYRAIRHFAGIPSGKPFDPADLDTTMPAFVTRIQKARKHLDDPVYTRKQKREFLHHWKVGHPKGKMRDARKALRQTIAAAIRQRHHHLHDLETEPPKQAMTAKDAQAWIHDYRQHHPHASDTDVHKALRAHIESMRRPRHWRRTVRQTREERRLIRTWNQTRKRADATLAMERSLLPMLKTTGSVIDSQAPLLASMAGMARGGRVAGRMAAAPRSAAGLRGFAAGGRVAPAAPAPVVVRPVIGITLDDPTLSALDPRIHATVDGKLAEVGEKAFHQKNTGGGRRSVLHR